MKKAREIILGWFFSAYIQNRVLPLADINLSLTTYFIVLQIGATLPCKITPIIDYTQEAWPSTFQFFRCFLIFHLISTVLFLNLKENSTCLETEKGKLTMCKVTSTHSSICINKRLKEHTHQILSYKSDGGIAFSNEKYKTDIHLLPDQ